MKASHIFLKKYLSSSRRLLIRESSNSVKGRNSVGYLARHAFSALSRLSFASETERVRTEANAKPPCENATNQITQKYTLNRGRL